MMAEYAEALKRNGIDYDGAMERFGGNAALSYAPHYVNRQ